VTNPSPTIAATVFAEARMAESAPAGAGSSRVGAVQRTLAPWVGLLPFFVFIGLFLVVPTVAVFVRAFDGGGGPSPMRTVLDEPFRSYFANSIRLSVFSAVAGGAIGVVAAVVVVRLQRPRWLRTVVSAFAGVAANMGGIVLAFMFIASLGLQGLATKILKTVGVDVPATLLTEGITGLVIVYLFFQIPLMFLVMLPAIDGLKPAWREAVANLGGTTFTYWRRVGVPVLLPAALGGMLLLFANAFAAYATAFALTTQAGKLVSVQIRFYMQGNVIAGQQNVGYAMAAWMIIIMLVTVGLYLLLRRRAERWTR
jgi:putative spermidine/putrescine transport system permease protein